MAKAIPLAIGDRVETKESISNIWLTFPKGTKGVVKDLVPSEYNDAIIPKVEFDGESFSAPVARNLLKKLK